MGWLRRSRAEQAGASPQGEMSPPVPPAPTSPSEPGPQASPAPTPVTEPVEASTAAGHGKYGPRVRVAAFEQAPDELTWQLPIRGELHRLMPGPDRPDYSLMLLEKPLLFYPPAGFDPGRLGAERLTADRRGRPMVQVHALVLCARFVGQQLHPGMTDLPVNIAYVIDQSLARDDSVDVAKIEYAGIGFLSEGPGDVDEQPAAEPVPDLPAPVGEPTDLVSHVGHEVAQLLRQGVAERRGAQVGRLQATVTIDPAQRIRGLTGNADGSAPEPTPETFERINAALARLTHLPPEHAVSALILHVDGSDVTVESTPRA